LLQKNQPTRRNIVFKSCSSLAVGFAIAFEEIDQEFKSKIDSRFVEESSQLYKSGEVIRILLQKRAISVFILCKIEK